MTNYIPNRLGAKEPYHHQLAQVAEPPSEPPGALLSLGSGPIWQEMLRETQTEKHLPEPSQSTPWGPMTLMDS